MGSGCILMVECWLIMLKALGSNSSAMKISKISVAVYDSYNQTYWAQYLTDYWKG